MVDKLTLPSKENAVQDKINEIIDNLGGGNPNPAFGTSSTAAATVEKAVSIPAITTLEVSQVIYVRPSVTSTVANSTIKLNNFTAYPMRYNNAAISTSTDSIVWNENFVSTFIFDGTYWQFAGHGLDTNTNTTYSAMSVSEGITGTATNSRTMRADYAKQIIQGTTLTGLSTADSSTVVATDSITTGIGKLQAQINASKILINITYDDLVTLKTNEELYEGAFYRITDYVTTCNAYTPRSGEPSRSAGHQFDIIIQALSNSTLADKGTASLHSGDTYFANSNLGAWQIWYDINNDTNKYKWADTTNGKGVIYRMIDERNNDLPYDFKNIQFYRDGSSSSYTTVSSYLTANDGYYYTFSLNTSGTISDYSIDGGSYCQKNIHGALGVGQGIGLPNSVWIETATAKELSNNDIGSNSYNNTCCGVFQRIHCPLGAFTNNITSDTFRNSTIASNFKNNVIGTSFDNNSIGNWFTNNTIGNTFKLNTIGESVRYCTFGTTTQYSRIGNYVTYITFGNSFNTGVIENYVNYISIPANTYNLTIKNNTSGASGSVLDCSGLPTSVNYSVVLRLDSNSGYIATWNDGITTYGKYKATSSTATWTDVNNKQVQSDWNQSDSTAVDYIKNKPSGISVDQTYDGTSTNAQSGVAIEGELTTNYQTKLVSGTNIKTVNNTSLLGSGNIDTSEVFIAEFGVTSYADIQTALSNNKVIIGYNDDTKEYYNFIGVKTHQSIGTCYAFSNIYGDTNTQSDVKNRVFYRGVSFWATQSSILEQTSNKVTSISSSSTDTQYPSAKCVYDELTDKADTDLSNLSATGQKVIDGQWVASPLTLATDVNASTTITQYDLSSYLPNDSYNYEIQMSFSMFTKTSSGNSISCYVGSDLITFTTSTYTNAIQIGQVRTRTNSNMTTSGNCKCPVGTGRYVDIYSPSGWTNGTYSLWLNGYRRLGTNS